MEYLNRQLDRSSYLSMNVKTFRKPSFLIREGKRYPFLENTLGKDDIIKIDT